MGHTALSLVAQQLPARARGADSRDMGFGGGWWGGWGCWGWGIGKIWNDIGILGPPAPFLTLCWGEGSPTEMDYRKKWYPYSNLSGGL